MVPSTWEDRTNQTIGTQGSDRIWKRVPVAPSVTRLFVYGTLRPELKDVSGCRLIQKSRSLGLGWVTGKLYDRGEYPVAVPASTSRFRVWGEVLEIGSDPALWRQLDAYEDYDRHCLQRSHFLRKVVEVAMNDSRKIPAQIYWYRFSVAGLEAIPRGNYFDFLLNNDRADSFRYFR